MASWIESLLQPNRPRESRFLLLVLSLLVIALATGCQAKRSTVEESKSPKRTRPSEDHLVVFASNSFLAEAVKSVAGSRVGLLWLIPPKTDPSSWHPTPTDLEKMQQAGLLVLNGAGFEPWVASVALPSSRMIRTANGFRERWIETDGVVHSHGPSGEHSHAGIASTTWLDFSLARQQVEAVRQRLQQLLPEEAEEFGIRCTSFLRELEELDQQMQQLATRVGQRPLIASHPFHQYWARRYRLNVKAVNWDSAESADAESLKELEEALQNFPAEIFLWEAEPAASNVENLNARGIRSLVFTPASNLPEHESWLAVMKQNLANLEQAVR